MDTLLGNMATAFEQLERFSTDHVVVIEQALSFLEPVAHIFVDSGSFHTYRIDGANSRWIALGDQERRSICSDSCHPADERKAANGGIVMNGSESSETGLILDDNVSAEQHTVRHDDLISDDAVVRDVGTCKDHATATEFGNAPALFGSTIDGAVLPEDVVRSDLCPGFLTVPLLILWVSTENGTGVNDAAFTDPGVTDDGGMMVEDTARSDHHIGSDEDPRTDGDIAGDIRRRIDGCRRVNQRFS